MPGDAFHRFGDDYLTTEGGTAAPDIISRVLLALGVEPLTDARHLLSPVPLPASSTVQPAPSDAPDESTSFVIEVSGPRLVPLLAIVETLNGDARIALDFPRLWGRTLGGAETAPPWFPLPYSPLDALPNADLPLGATAFSWALSGIVSQGNEAVRELNGYRSELEKRFAPFGWGVTLREAPGDAVARAARLHRIKSRFARAVEMRLIPHGRPFPSRQVWRSAYALGLTWGEMDLFHWNDPISGRRLFTLSSLGQPGYFLPERAAEGEGIPGLSLGFELPTAPAPLETFDRMAIALDYLRHQLGGKPTASDGAEMDAERLYLEREQLEEAVKALINTGISPGSPEAVRYF